MIYLYVDRNTVKKLSLKKTILGQQETSFFQKTYENDFFEKGKPVNIDLLASGIKEVLIQSNERQSSDNQVFLILPQDMFNFFRTVVPSDIAPTALESFIMDKARSLLPIESQDNPHSYFVQDIDNEKVVTFYSMDKGIFLELRQVFTLIDLKIASILPDTLAYFKLFEKTLRKEKKELIFYAVWEKNNIYGYLFDSFGLLKPDRIIFDASDETKIEEAMKLKFEQISTEQNRKINRLIVSGSKSETIRQDTFTKSVGVWTNPLKRIVPTFYEEYLKMLVVGKEAVFPLLSLDVCFGAFIFSQENRNFSMLKGSVRLPAQPGKGFAMPKLRLPLKEIMIFVASFVLSFMAFILVSNNRSGIKLPNLTAKKPTPTPTPVPPTATPTPAVNRSEIKIKVLNGGGVAGKATEVRDILKSKGYSEILTGNADSFEFEKTEVDIKKASSSAFFTIKEDLKDYVTLTTSGDLDPEEASDVVITIGKDFK